MSTEKPTRTVPAIAQSIDSILRTPAAKQPVRPLAKLRPSWIGPPPSDRPRTPGEAPAMKQHVTVEYSSPGLQPPVYILTSLSEPQWEPVEMEAKDKDGAEYRFCRAFDVEEGEYQYKFRLGPGDWWVCDESRPTVDDGMGNKNNLLPVKSQELKAPQLKTEETGSQSAVSAPAPKPPAIMVPEQHPPPQSAITPAPHESVAPTPLPKQETFVPNKGSESEQTPDREVSDPLPTEESPDDAEALVQNTDEESDSSDSESSSNSDSEDETTNSPLLRHESVSPHSAEQEHAPLFRHESIALGYNHHEPAATTISLTTPPHQAGSPAHVRYKGDVSDLSLEHFPTDHAGILAKIHRTSISLPEHEPMDDDDVLRSPTQALSDMSMSPPALPSVQEADEELERIQQVEKEEYDKEKESGEETDPLREVESELENEDFEPKVPITEVIEIDRVIVVEVVERRKSAIASLVEKAGGRNSVL